MDRDETVVILFGTILVLFTAMLDPHMSLGLAVSSLVSVVVYMLARRHS